MDKKTICPTEVDYIIDLKNAFDKVPYPFVI